MSEAKNPAMAFDPDFWHEHWRSAGPSGAMSSAPANPYVMHEAAARPDLGSSDLGSSDPGAPTPAALEVGCGAGTEALALARAGWAVTAVDTSADALRTAAQRAADQGLEEKLTWVQADVTIWSPESQYDLVTCSYVHTLMPQPRLLRRLAGWTAPGGTLLMVGHAPGQHSPGEHSHPPKEATDQLALLTDALDTHDWAISAFRTSRTVSMPGSQLTPGGKQKTLHDVVLRAQRR